MLNVQCFILLFFFVHLFECKFDLFFGGLKPPKRKSGERCSNSTESECEEGLICIGSTDPRCGYIYAKPYERCGGWGHKGNKITDKFAR